MKNWIKKALAKAKEFLQWLWGECKDWRTLVLLGIVSLVLSLPIWVGYILGFVFKWTWATVMATAVWAFWWLPGAPFFTIAVSITLAIKKIHEKWKQKHSPPTNSDNTGDVNTASDNMNNDNTQA